MQYNKWTAEEMRYIISAAKEYKTSKIDWIAIQALVPHRTVQQCKSFYNNTVKEYDIYKCSQQVFFWNELELVIFLQQILYNKKNAVKILYGSFFTPFVLWSLLQFQSLIQYIFRFSFQYYLQLS
ncbi:SANT/Myb_domain [Hexamita inflata]|uniref:SANT/Myb domain n=1 Tax=Hexamita inflata TaxID=28002 RepID=A0AA86P5F1_9EUKA|nr:SANT/Myb domain [Hexamita inflata]